MNLHISGHHVEVTPALRQFVTDKMQRLVRHAENLMDIDVILAVDSGHHDGHHSGHHGAVRHKAEARVHLRGSNLFAESVANDMYAAIDALMDKLDRQATKANGKRKDNRVRAVDVTLH